MGKKQRQPNKDEGRPTDRQAKRVTLINNSTLVQTTTTLAGQRTTWRLKLTEVRPLCRGVAWPRIVLSYDRDYVIQCALLHQQDTKLNNQNALFNYSILLCSATATEGRWLSCSKWLVCVPRMQLCRFRKFRRNTWAKFRWKWSLLEIR